MARRPRRKVVDERLSGLTEAGRTAFGWLVRGVVVGAASGGLLVTDDEVRDAILAGTEQTDGIQHLNALLARRAEEQGVAWPPT